MRTQVFLLLGKLFVDLVALAAGYCVDPDSTFFGIDNIVHFTPSSNQQYADQSQLQVSCGAGYVNGSGSSTTSIKCSTDNWEWPPGLFIYCYKACTDPPALGPGITFSGGRTAPYPSQIWLQLECIPGFTTDYGYEFVMCDFFSNGTYYWQWPYTLLICSPPATTPEATTLTTQPTTSTSAPTGCPPPVGLDIYTQVMVPSAFYVSSSVIYLSCMSGPYVAVSGGSFGTCGASGLWQWDTGAPLICEEACTAPPNVTTGIVMVGATPPYLQGTALTAQCASGFRDLIGDTSVYCLVDFYYNTYSWDWLNGMPPSCTQVLSLTTGISGGDIVTVPYGSQYTFDAVSLTATASQSGNLVGLNFTWQCRRQCQDWSDVLLAAPMTSSCIPVEVNPLGCFLDSSQNDGTGILSRSTTGTLTVNTTLLVRDTLIIRVAVQAGSDTANDTQTVVFVSPGAMPLTITCKRNCQDYLSIEDQLSLQAYLPSYNVYPVVWNWELYNLSTDLTLTLLPKASWTSYCFTGDNTSSVAISPSFWSSLPPESRFALSATATTTVGGSNSSSTSYYSAAVGAPPKPGNCTIEPANGTALTTNFTISCSVFSSANTPLNYEIGISTDGLSYSWIRSGPGLRTLGRNLNLPQGLQENNFMTNISVKATDSIGMSVNVSLSAVVIGPTDTQLNNILTQLSSGGSLSSLGLNKDNPNQALAFAGAVALTLQSQALTSSGVNSTVITKGQVVAAREALTSLLTYVPIVDVRSAIAVQSVLSNVLNGGEAISARARESAMTMMENSATVVSNTSGSQISGQQMKTSLSASLACADYLLASNTYAITNNPSSTTDLSGRTASVIQTMSASQLSTAVPGEDSTTRSATITLTTSKKYSTDITPAASDDGRGNGLTFPNLVPALNSTNPEVIMSQVAVFKNNPFLTSSRPANVNSSVLMVFVTAENSNTSLATQNMAMPTHVFSGRSFNESSSRGAPLLQGMALHIQDLSTTATVHKIQIVQSQSIYMKFNWFRITNGNNLTSALAGGNGSSMPATNYSLLVYASAGGTPDPHSYDINCTLPIVTSKNSTTNQTTIISGGAYSRQCENKSSTVCNGERVFANLSLFPGGDASQIDKQTCFIPANWLQRMSGTVLSVTLRFIKTSEISKIGQSFNATNSLDISSSNISIGYSAQTFMQNCLYWSFVESQWKSDSCVGGPLSNLNTSHCICTRLSEQKSSILSSGRRKRSSTPAGAQSTAIAFGSSITLSINAVNLKDSAFNHLDDNPLIFSVLLSIICIYLCTLVWTVKRDRLDGEKATIIPLIDNQPHHKFLYEVTVYTGNMMRAGTSANVCMIITGDDGDSGPRLFCGSDRAVFQRGGTDSFLLAVPKSLGSLTYLRVWHDNSGENPSWFLSRITIVDLQTSQKYYFVVNKWLSEVDSDCMRCRVVIVAGRRDLTAFGNMFWIKARKDLVDGHLWFSVAARPHTSRFTRTQRCTCCLTLLFTLMTANIMFYGKLKTTDMVFKLGPMLLSVGSILQGIISSFVVLPINIAIVQIFRKSEPMEVRKVIRNRKNRVSNETLYLPGSQTPITAAMWIRRSENAASWMKEPVIKSDDNSVALWQLVMSSGTPASQREAPEEKKKEAFTVNLKAPTPEKLKRVKLLSRKRLLPWWTVFIAYFLCLAACAVSFWYVVEIGFVLGQESATKWLVSFITSIIESICLSQPVKVIVRAIFFALVVKKPAHDEDSVVHRGKREAYLERHLKASRRNHLDFMGLIRSRFKIPEPPSTETVHEVEKRRIRQQETLDIIKEVGVYVIFITLMMMTSYGNLDKNSQMSYAYIEKNIRLGLSEQVTAIPPMLDKVHEYKSLWNWMTTTVLPSLYSDYSVMSKRSEVNYNRKMHSSFYLVLNPRIRQYRMKIGQHCDYQLYNKSLCYGAYMSSPEDRGSYSARWISGKAEADAYKDAWAWQSEAEGGGYAINGEVGAYPGSGYSIKLGNTSSSAAAVMSYLQQNEWLDRRTRAIMIEFDMYNPSVNLLATSFITIEFLPTGACRPTYGMILERYDPYPLGLMATLVAEIGSLIFVAYFTYSEVRLLTRLKANYIRSIENIVNMVSLLFCITAIALFISKVSTQEEMKSKAATKVPGSFVTFQAAAYWYECYRGCLGLTTFMATIKFLKLLRFNSRISMLTTTLKTVTPRLLSLLLVMLAIFLAFAHMTFLIYGANLKIYYSFPATCMNLLIMMMNKFDYVSIEIANPTFAPFFIIGFAVVINFTMLNVMVAIIMEGFQDTRTTLNRKRNKYEVLELIIDMFKTTSGLGALRKGTPNALSKSNEDSSGRKSSKDALTDNDPHRKAVLAVIQLHRTFKKFVDPAPSKRILYSDPKQPPKLD